MSVHYVIEEAADYCISEALNTLHQNKIDKNDLFIFIKKGNGIFYINKITDSESGKSRYPEIMFRHPFNEREIINKEAYTLFCAAREKFKPYNIYFFISDSENCKNIYYWIESRLLYKEDLTVQFTGKEEKIMENVSEGLKLTQVMKYDFKRLCLNKKIRDGSCYEILTAYSRVIPSSKKERSLIYNEIRTKLNSIDY